LKGQYKAKTTVYAAEILQDRFSRFFQQAST